MLGRYPHTGKLVLTKEVENPNGIPSSIKVETDIKGRFSPATQGKGLEYSAKFFCPNFVADPFEYDGHSLYYEGKRFVIVQMFAYQTHCEIWLE